MNIAYNLRLYLIPERFVILMEFAIVKTRFWIPKANLKLVTAISLYAFYLST